MAGKRKEHLRIICFWTSREFFSQMERIRQLPPTPHDRSSFVRNCITKAMNDSVSLKHIRQHLKALRDMLETVGSPLCESETTHNINLWLDKDIIRQADEMRMKVSPPITRSSFIRHCLAQEMDRFDYDYNPGAVFLCEGKKRYAASTLLCSD